MTRPQTQRFFKLVYNKKDILYFNDKMEAKAKRAELLAAQPELGHISLCRGPDHWKGETQPNGGAE